MVDFAKLLKESREKRAMKKKPKRKEKAGESRPLKDTRERRKPVVVFGGPTKETTEATHAGTIIGVHVVRAKSPKEVDVAYILRSKLVTYPAGDGNRELEVVERSEPIKLDDHPQLRWIFALLPLARRALEEIAATDEFTVMLNRCRGRNKAFTPGTD